MRNLKTNVLLMSFFFYLLTNNCIYAANPFDDEVAINDYESVENIEQVNLAVSCDDTEKDENVYPCEGTINCQYGQYCRLSPWGEVVKIIPPGTKVTITGKEGDWYTIEYNGQKCYLHYSLVDTPYVPAYDGYHPYAYSKTDSSEKKVVNKNTSTNKTNDTNTKVVVSSTTNTNKNKKVSPKKTSSKNTESVKVDTTKSINGPDVPECLLNGLEKAKSSVWNQSNKCLQFSGTIAKEAGAKTNGGDASQPQETWKKTRDISLRGHKISDLKEAALTGKILPGMLIHVKAHYDKDPDYHTADDGHHWFMYMGLVDGEPMFVDNIKENKLRNTEAQATTFNSSKYGERRITAVYDPFADQR